MLLARSIRERLAAGCSVRGVRLILVSLARVKKPASMLRTWLRWPDFAVNRVACMH